MTETGEGGITGIDGNSETFPRRTGQASTRRRARRRILLEAGADAILERDGAPADR